MANSFNINDPTQFAEYYNKLVNNYKANCVLLFKNDVIYFTDGIFGVRLKTFWNFGKPGFQVINPERVGSVVNVLRKEDIITLKTNDYAKVNNRKRRVNSYRIEMKPLDDKCKEQIEYLDYLSTIKKDLSDLDGAITYSFEICHDIPIRFSEYLTRFIPFWKVLGLKEFKIYQNRKGIYHAIGVYSRTYSKDMLVVFK